MEKSGRLYEAIQFYRRAVQLVPDIEFKLEHGTKHKKRRSHLESESSELPEDLIGKIDENCCVTDGGLVGMISRKLGKHQLFCADVEQRVSFLPTWGLSASAVNSKTIVFEMDLMSMSVSLLYPRLYPIYCLFQMTHISSLPMEIILYILKWVVSSDLDLRSLEVCSRVCRGFYICSRDPEIWRLACMRAWGLNCGSSPKPFTSWREMYIERSRLHFGGCYISKTTYIRQGENSFQDQFYRPCHLVAYYRYLRYESNYCYLRFESNSRYKTPSFYQSSNFSPGSFPRAWS